MNIRKEHSTAILVDAACDIPDEIANDRNIFVLPIKFSVGEKFYKDRRVPEMLRAYNERTDLGSSSTVATEPTSADSIRNFVVSHIADRFENLLIMSISSTRSKIFENARAAIRMLPHVVEGKSHKLENVIAIDTLSVFSGQALLAYIASTVSSEEHSIELKELSNIVKDYIGRLTTYAVVQDLSYLKNRGQRRNEKSVRRMDYFIAKTLKLTPIGMWKKGESKKIGVSRSYDGAVAHLVKITSQSIEKGLSFNTIIVSYSGDIETFRRSNVYITLEEFCRARNVRCILSTMSITATIYMGPNAITISLCN